MIRQWKTPHLVDLFIVNQASQISEGAWLSMEDSLVSSIMINDCEQLLLMVIPSPTIDHEFRISIRHE